MKKILCGLIVFAMTATVANAALNIPNIPADMDQFRKLHTWPKLDKTSNAIGLDDDLNEVRDDIGQYIESRELTQDQEEFLLNVAAVYQKMVAHGVRGTLDPVAITARYHRTMACPGNIGSLDPQVESRYLFAFTFNTESRMEAFLKFDSDERKIHPTYANIDCSAFAQAE